MALAEERPAPRRRSSPRYEGSWRDLADVDLARYLATYRRALALVGDEPLDPETRAGTAAYLAMLVADGEREEARRRRAAQLGVPRDAALFPPDWLADLKARIRLDVLLEYEAGAVLGRPGKDGVRRGPCPFCGTSPRSTSLAVHPDGPDGGWWHCFACLDGGDAIAAIMRAYGDPFPEAVRRLAATGNVPLPGSREARARRAAHMPGKVAV